MQPLYAVLPNLSCIALRDPFKLLVEYGFHLKKDACFYQLHQLPLLGDSNHLLVLALSRCTTDITGWMSGDSNISSLYARLGIFFTMGKSPHLDWA